MMSPEAVAAIPLPGFESGFGYTLWETSAQFSPFALPLEPAQEQVQAQTATGSGSEELSRDKERRIRRMMSNRESARKSRMRKQQHLEELRNKADRLRSENLKLASWLSAVTRHCLLFCRDNDRLRSEASALRRRLADIRRVHIFRQLQRLLPLPACNGAGSTVHTGWPQGPIQSGLQ